MPITGLAHVNVRASEAMIERVRHFHAGILGLVEGRRPPFRSRGYWLYAGPLDVMHLTIDPSMDDDTPARTGWLDHFAFAATDLKDTMARLDAHGVPYQVEHVPGSGETQLFTRDPAGIAIELNFNTP
ncbi:VOC family protein [Luteibacter sp. SG786]|uniref:VOC family protein n=1 Tax=Luteibacter sp. SG786 TaxID=2587130 RepID=UPI00141E09D1|nr:VOC family protein [Luteibacter sp. SG786]NII53080.1 glyoxylase I family protein [Luteibacter sp. SG786]